MKLQLPKYDCKIRGTLPPIYYKPNTTIGKSLKDKFYSFKVNIKTQPGERDSKMVAIYVPLFRTGSPEALLKFVTIIHKIIRGQDLYTGPQKFGMTWDLVVGEVPQVFEQKSQETGTKNK